MYCSFLIHVLLSPHDVMLLDVTLFICLIAKLFLNFILLYCCSLLNYVLLSPHDVIFLMLHHLPAQLLLFLDFSHILFFIVNPCSPALAIFISNLTICYLTLYHLPQSQNTCRKSVMLNLITERQ